MTDKELMQQALEALEGLADTSWTAAFKQRKYDSDEPNENVERERVLGAITALRERLEPVAYDKTELNAFVQNLYDEKMREGKHGHYETMFYVVHQAIKRVTTPPRREWVGLTDEEKAEILSLKWWDWEDTFDLDGFIRAIEAKLKEKNA